MPGPGSGAARLRATPRSLRSGGVGTRRNVSRQASGFEEVAPPPPHRESAKETDRILDHDRQGTMRSAGSDRAQRRIGERPGG